MTTNLSTSRNARATDVSGSTPIGKTIWTISMSSSTTTNARAARSAMPSVASAAAVVVDARRAPEAVAPHAADIPHRGIQAVAAVVPAAMTMIIIHLSAVAVEAVGDSFWDSLREEIYQKAQ